MSQVWSEQNLSIQATDIPFKQCALNKTQSGQSDYRTSCLQSVAEALKWQ